MDRTRTLLRYVRISTTVFFAVLSVLLIVLWVRSYWWSDACLGGFHKYLYYIDSLRGGMALSVFDPSDEEVVVIRSFKTVSDPVTESMKKRLHALGAPPWLSVWGFDWWFAASGFAISMPHWFAVLLTGLLAALPWIKLRFSLRTMLIGMTLIAVICGAIAMM